MRVSRSIRPAGTLLTATVLCLGLAVVSAPGAAGTGTGTGRAVLAANDGWASATTGTTGGARADAAHTVTVRTRAQLVAALGGTNATNGADATPKIIYISGTVDLNSDDSARHLNCQDYSTDGYSLAAYLAAYDPAVWGTTTEPSGAQEDARAASAKLQGEQVQINVGSNTTIVGVHGGRLLGGGLVVKNADNVIIRNLTVEDAADCFPQWDPTDGATGNWNSLYDAVALYNATHVWVDHNTFTDGANQDAAQPLYFDRPYQVHDGQLDITKGADLVTASWNVFKDHDKTNLVGSSDSSTVDAGHLRVTFHHNFWQNTVQRSPRVRFGQVDVYNNYYTPKAGDFEYAFGVGKSSQIVAEANYFKLPSGIPAAKLIYNWGGTALTDSGNLVNGRVTDLIGAFNTANPAKPLAAGAGWTPTLRAQVSPACAVPGLVTARAGAGRI
ncbi:pectate lyase [Streptomyces sp. CB03911]|uniref:pectate lyase family protein n=1 Tax=Streptomycetaceae TaxID=2062 RepID=UPI00093CB49D|nr:pectate lyase [Streptomyces sp. CB03911]OKI30761.1 pectate lyase [Streptomyces sp. CB03911]